MESLRKEADVYASGGIGEDADTPETRAACAALYARMLKRGDGAWDPVSKLDTTLATMLSMSGCKPAAFCLEIAEGLSRMIKTKRDIGSLTEGVLHKVVPPAVAKRMMVYVEDVKFFYDFVDKKSGRNTFVDNLVFFLDAADPVPVEKRTNSPEVKIFYGRSKKGLVCKLVGIEEEYYQSDSSYNMSNPSTKSVVSSHKLGEVDVRGTSRWEKVRKGDLEGIIWSSECPSFVVK